MNNDRFFDVPRTFYTTSWGEIQVPMFFYDVSERRLNYFVDYERVTPYLAGTGLVPCRFFNGKALVSLIFFQYRDVTIGPYDEVTITIVVRPAMLPDPRPYLTKVLFKKRGAGWGNMGAYVLEMPVTIPAARAAGREIWGYPKFLTKIPNRLSGRKFEFGVLDPDTGKPILSVKGEAGPGVPTKAFDLVTFNNYRDAIWKIIIDADAWYTNALPRHLEVEVGGGNHRMARNLRALGLAELRPFVIQSADRLRTRLNPGMPVASWNSPELPYRYKEEIDFGKRKRSGSQVLKPGRRKS
ncbi:MAG: acetoacetate decarboxylase family protein [Spirochaetes bacterium]|nr:acetoacetate decarboxylase family protein [Spirochaetota bacterium]